MGVRINSAVLAVAAFSSLVLFAGVHGQEVAPEMALPSVVTLTVHNLDGTTESGNGFLTVRDGIVAAAWHIVKDAKSVVARFPSGDQYECTGIIDKDEVRNVALIRIRVFGKPTLKMAAVDQAAGVRLNLVAVKDSAFGILPVSVAEPASKDGMTWARLDGEIPPGNSGGPITNGEGAVVGILTLKTLDEKIVGYMIPARFILALDSSLPTQPWAPIAMPPVPQPPAAPSAGLDEIDALIGESYVVLNDNLHLFEWADLGTKGFGFKNGVPQSVYDFQQYMDIMGIKLSEARTDDILRQRVIKALLQIIAMQKATTENFIRAVVAGQQLGSWEAQSQDAYNRAKSIRKSIDVKLAEALTDLTALEKESAKFREFLFPEIRYWLKLQPRPSGYIFGVITYARRPFVLLVAYVDGFAYKIGFRAGDTIKSVAGRDFTETNDIEQLKMLVRENLGKKIDAVVERNGKVVNIKLKIPKEIPPGAIFK